MATYCRWVDKGCCTIRDKSGHLIAMQFNRAQYLLLAAMFTQALAGKPIRIVILKARKQGITTFAQTFAVFLVAHYRQQVALTMAHIGIATDEIFHIGKLAAVQYMADMSSVSEQALDIETEVWRVMSPSLCSRYWCYTAAAESAAAGGTPNYLHLSEVALWTHRAKRNTYPSSVKAVPDLPETVIIEESTARGQEAFFAKFTNAHQPEHPYDPVFVPWFLDEELSIPLLGVFGASVQAGESVRSTAASGKGEAVRLLDEDELALVSLAEEHGVDLTWGALAWRRGEILNIGPANFRQEYPSTPDEAIAGEQGRVLEGLRGCLIDELPFAYETTEWDQERVGGMDFGFYDPTAIAHAIYRDQVLYIVGLYRATKGLSSEHAQELREGHRYYCDPSDVQAREDMRACIHPGTGIGLVGAPRAKAVGGGIVIEEWRAVQTMIRQGRLKVLRSVAAQAILEADNFFWNEQTGTPDKTRGESWGHFDTLDALRYCVMGVLVRHGGIVRPSRDGGRPLSRRDRLRAL